MQEKIKDEVSPRELILQLKEWGAYLWSKWLLILTFGLLGGIAGFVYAYFNKPLYTATLSFALEEDKGGGVGGAMGLASQLGFDVGGAGAGGMFSSANLLELMKSRSLVEKTLLNPITIKDKTLSLAEYYIEFMGWRESWEKDQYLRNLHYPVNPDRSRFTLLQDSVLGVIYNDFIGENLVVSPRDKKTSISLIEVKTRNELFSKIFAESLAAVVSDFYVLTKTKKYSQNVTVLQRQTDSVRNELNSAITGVAVLNDNIYNLNPAMNQKRAAPAKKQIDVQANTAILTQLVQNLELAKMSLMKETPLIQVIDRPVLPLKKTKMSKRNTLILGGFLGGFLTILVLLIRRIIGKIASSL